MPKKVKNNRNFSTEPPKLNHSSCCVQLFSMIIITIMIIISQYGVPWVQLARTHRASSSACQPAARSRARSKLAADANFCESNRNLTDRLATQTVRANVLLFRTERTKTKKLSRRARARSARVFSTPFELANSGEHEWEERIFVRLFVNPESIKSESPARASCSRHTEHCSTRTVLDAWVNWKQTRASCERERWWSQPFQHQTTVSPWRRVRTHQTAKAPLLGSKVASVSISKPRARRRINTPPILVEVFVYSWSSFIECDMDTANDSAVQHGQCTRSIELWIDFGFQERALSARWNVW